MRVSRVERVCDDHHTHVSKLCRAGKRGQRSRHTLDAPALEYVPATHEVHVAADDEVAPACPYVPAAHAEPEHVAVAADVDPAGPCLPAAHAEPEHELAPVK